MKKSPKKSVKKAQRKPTRSSKSGVNWLRLVRLRLSAPGVPHGHDWLGYGIMVGRYLGAAFLGHWRKHPEPPFEFGDDTELTAAWDELSPKLIQVWEQQQADVRKFFHGVHLGLTASRRNMEPRTVADKIYDVMAKNPPRVRTLQALGKGQRGLLQWLRDEEHISCTPKQLDKLCRRIPLSFPSRPGRPLGSKNFARNPRSNKSAPRRNALSDWL